MKKRIEDYKIAKNFRLYEFIEGTAIGTIGADMNWEYLNDLSEQDFKTFLQLVEMNANYLQMLRDWINKEMKTNKIGIQITSGFRCLKYEKLKKRSGKSQHCVKIASDIRLTGIIDNKIYDNTMSVLYDHIDGNEVRYMGGLARKLDYSKGRKWRFIHIDFRTATSEHIRRGYGERWEY